MEISFIWYAVFCALFGALNTLLVLYLFKQWFRGRIDGLSLCAVIIMQGFFSSSFMQEPNVIRILAEMGYWKQFASGGISIILWLLFIILGVGVYNKFCDLFDRLYFKKHSG